MDSQTGSSHMARPFFIDTDTASDDAVSDGSAKCPVHKLIPLAFEVTKRLEAFNIEYRLSNYCMKDRYSLLPN